MTVETAPSPDTRPEVDMSIPENFHSDTPTDADEGNRVPLVASDPKGDHQVDRQYYTWDRHCPDLILEDSFRCDICGQDASKEADLKNHQLQTHINPFYLKPDDLSAAQLPQDMNDWRPNSDEDFSGLFRCHKCKSTVFNQRQELKIHLDGHANILENGHVHLEKTKEDIIVEGQDGNKLAIKETKELDLEKAMRPEDFEDLVGSTRRVRKSRTKLEGKENEMVISRVGKKKKRILKKKTMQQPSDRKRPKGKKKKQLAKVLSSSQVPSENGTTAITARPVRKCKTTATTLVALNLADEKLDIDFEDPSSSSSSESEDPEEDSKKGEKQEENNMEQSHDEVGEGVEQDLTVKNEVQAVVSQKKNSSSDPKSKRMKGRPPKKEKKKRKSKKKPAKLKSQITTQKRSRGRPKKGQTKQETLSEVAHSTKVRESFPRKCVTTKRATTELERLKYINKQVTGKDSVYQCFGCEDRFESYSALQKHKSGSLASCHKKFNMMLLLPNDSKSASKPSSEWDQELSMFLDNACKNVPETTFNNMHGTLKDIKTDTGLYFQKKVNLGTIEKVKMNYSGFWSTKDIWESGGWEMHKDLLSWNKYENPNSSHPSFLTQMSNFEWSQQINIKSIYDQSITYKPKSRKRLYSSSSSEPETSRKDTKGGNFFPNSLNLKQVGKSVKYMNASERTKRRKQLENAPVEPPSEGKLNGEWELEHLFMCSVCAQSYDEVREVMHHKWDAHPYCLVAHVTLQSGLNLPESTTLYPQLGRHLRTVEEIESSHKRRKFSNYNKVLSKNSSSSKPQLCSKCSSSFQSLEDFHAHILLCGGDEDWDESSKKKKKKKKVATPKATKRSDTKEEAAEKRRARFAKFDVPPPKVTETGRMTRLQADILKQEKKEEWMEKRKRSKRGRKLAQKKGGKKNGPKKSDPEEKSKEKKVKKCFPTLFALERPRRSSVSYTSIIREGWSTNPNTSVVAKKQENDQNAKEPMDDITVKIETKEEECETIEDLKNVEPERNSPRRVQEEQQAKLSPEAASADEPKAVKPSRASPRRVSSTTAEGCQTSSPEEKKPLKGRPPKRRASVGPLPSDSKRPKTIGSSSRLSLDSKCEEVRAVSPLEKDQRVEEKSLPSRPKKDLVVKPSERKSEDESEESDSSSGSNGLVPSKRLGPRKLGVNFLRHNGRTVFPKEVKIDSIRRIAGGETQVRVARDLQCPVSTIASWWQRRSVLCPEDFGTRPSNTEVKKEDKTDRLESKSYPIVPYKRNCLLLTMKQRIEEAFRKKEAKNLNGKNLSEHCQMNEKDLVNGGSQDTIVENVCSKSVIYQQSDASKCDSDLAATVAAPRTSSGLSMILENYGSDDIMEDDEIDTLS